MWSHLVFAAAAAIVAAPVVEGGQSTAAKGRQDQAEGQFNKETQMKFKRKNSQKKAPMLSCRQHVSIPSSHFFCLFLHTVVTSENDLCEYISDNAGGYTGVNQLCGHAPYILSFADTTKQSPLMRG